jgi:hypothetical protein
MFEKSVIKKVSFCLVFVFFVMNSENFSCKFNIPFHGIGNEKLALISALQTGELKHEVLEMIYKTLNEVYKKQGLKGEMLDKAIQEFYKDLGKTLGMKIDMSEVIMHEDSLKKIKTIKIQYNEKKYEHKIVLNYREININSDVLLMRGFSLPKDMLINIFEILPIPNYLSCMRACRALKDLLKSDRISKSKCIEWCNKNNRDEKYLYILIQRYEENWHALLKAIITKKQYIPITKTRYDELCDKRTKNNINNEPIGLDILAYKFINSYLFDDHDDLLKEYDKIVIVKEFEKIMFNKEQFSNDILNILKELFQNNSTPDSIKAEIIRVMIDASSKQTIQVLAELLLNDNLNNMFFNTQNENLRTNIIQALKFICTKADDSNIVYYEQALIKLKELFENTKDIYKAEIINFLNNMCKNNTYINLCMEKLIELLLSDNLSDMFFNTQNENLQMAIIEGLLTICEYPDTSVSQQAVTKLSEILLNNNINVIFDKVKHKFMNINNILVGIINDKPSLKEDIILGFITICLYPNISVLIGCKAIIKLVELSRLKSLTIDLKGKIKGCLLSISKFSHINKLLSDCAFEEGRDELINFVENQGNNRKLFIKEKKKEIKNKYGSLKITKNISEYPVILERIWDDVEQIALSLRQTPTECMNAIFPELIEIIFSMQMQVDGIAESTCLNDKLFLYYKPKIDLIKKAIKQKIQKERLIMLCDGIVIYCAVTAYGKEIKKIISKSLGYYMTINNIRKIHRLIFEVLQEIFHGKMNVRFCVRMQDMIFNMMPREYYRVVLNYEGMKRIVVAA